MLKHRFTRQNLTTLKEVSLSLTNLSKKPSLPSFNSYLDLSESVESELGIESITGSLPSFESVEEISNNTRDKSLFLKSILQKGQNELRKRFERVGFKKGVSVDDCTYDDSQTTAVTSEEGQNEVESKPLVVGVVPDPPEQSNVTDMLNELRSGNNLEKFLESHGLSTSGINLPHLKAAFEQFLSKQTAKQKEIAKWEQKLNDLKELTDDVKLEKWLESLGVPASKVPIPLIKNEIKRFFETPEKPNENTMSSSIDEPHWGKKVEKDGIKNAIFYEDSIDDDDVETQVKTMGLNNTLSNPGLENLSKDEGITSRTAFSQRYARCEPIEEFKGRSLIYQENTLPHRLWEDFKELSPAKQVAIVVGITVVVASVGFVSSRIFMMVLPGALGSMNGYWTDVFAQWFIQRQDTSYHMLSHTALNAKPLSYTWANQYILWKYC